MVGCGSFHRLTSCEHIGSRQVAAFKEKIRPERMKQRLKIYDVDTYKTSKFSNLLIWHTKTLMQKNYLSEVCRHG